MPYRLKTGESVQHGVRRVINQQIERALDELADPDLDRAETIHQVRKRCKKIRGALRLVRGGLGDAYAMENAWYRDAARRLSALRDAQVMVETGEALARHFAGQVDGDTIQAIEGHLVACRDALMNDRERIAELLEDFRSALEAGQNRVPSLTIRGDGHQAALAGMRKTYGRAWAAMDAADDQPGPETFHEWRKRVKYHRYHLRLLQEAWPGVIEAREDATHQLGRWLGDHHDCWVLRALILNDPTCSATQEGQQHIIALIDRRIAQIEQASRPLGQRLFAEKPKHLARRFSTYLGIWSQEH
jgi:CHAD domain-containing protein